MVRGKSGERSVSVFPTHPRWLVFSQGGPGLTGKLTTTDNAITYQNNVMLFVCHPKILHKHCLQFLLGVKMAPRETQKNTFNNQNGQLGNSEIPCCPGFSQHTNTSIKAHLVSRPFSFHLPFSEVSVMANLDVLLIKVYKKL